VVVFTSKFSLLDDDRLLSLLRQISGSLKLLSVEGSREFMSVPGQLHKVIMSLAEVVSYDTSDSTILSVRNAGRRYIKLLSTFTVDMAHVTCFCLF